MNTVETEDASATRSSVFASLLILVGFVLLGLFVGQLIGFAVALLLFQFDLSFVTGIIADPSAYPEARLPLLIMQAGGTLFGFIMAPLLHHRLIDQRHSSSLFHTAYLDYAMLSVVFVVVIAFMMANSVIIEWNMNLDLGKFSTSFEEWARAKEEQLRELTEYLTRFDDLGGLMAGLLVIAVLPAIGEEIVFRGMLQRKLHQMTHMPHLSIWIAAFIFSAIHLQFYGFFPRMLLGALFGYIYYWSGNLWYPIFAHFINNGLTLVMLYLYQQKATDVDVEATDAIPWTAALLALLAGAALLAYFKKSIAKKRSAENG